MKSKKGTLEEITKAWEEGQCLLVRESERGRERESVCVHVRLLVHATTMHELMATLSLTHIHDDHAGGIKRARLLRDFVVKVYSPQDDHSINKGRLEALIRLRQSTKEWKKNTQGFEWCAGADMEAKGWPKNLVLY